MKIADQNVSTGILRQNILEKANEAFSGNKKTEDFSKKIDEAIIWLGIVEIRANELDHPIVIDECIRLAKKFSNPNSYKFVNAKLDELLKKQ